jgi:hypothetical protein
MLQMKHLKTVAIVASMAAMTSGGVALANAGSATATAPVKSTPAVTVAETTSTVDVGNAQVGDQTTPDTQATVAGSEASSEVAGVEASGSEVATNDGPGGHADAAGVNVDHQFQGQE